jgi:hypothetical protein
MKNNVNPIAKLGSLHIKPNWRYELLQNPAKYQMQDFVSIPSSNSGCLKRFLSVGLPYEVNYKFPDYLMPHTDGLSDEERDIFGALWERSFKRDKTQKISIDTQQALFKRNPVWNLKYVENIQDEFLKRLIYHVSNYRFDPYIKFAIDMSRSEEHSLIFKFIGYGIYSKLTDVQIAKRWSLSLRQVEAIRELFYDFSRFPKDRVANFTYLRQLANIGVIDDVDFNFFKRAFELGDLGIRAIIDYNNLLPTEKREVEAFLASTVVTNTLSLNFTVKTYKDAVTYGAIVSNLASYYIKHKESSYMDAKIKNLNAMTSRIENELIGDVAELSELDNQMIALLREHSLEEVPQLEYKTLADLKK